MAAKYDIESLLSDMETFLKANLNTEITALNAEKNDTITLASVDNAAYFFQTLNEATVAYDPFLLYGIEDIDTNGIGPGSTRIYQISVLILVVDDGMDGNIVKRAFRYTRVLEDLFLRKWDIAVNNSIRFKVTGVRPDVVRLLNSSQYHRISGVDLECVLG